MELTGGPAPHGFMRRIRSFISESSTGWESSDKLLDFKTTSSAALAAVIPNFFDAVRSGDRECVQHALRDHPELVGSRDLSQHDALHLAVINGDIEMIQLLAGHSSNLNSKDADGNTPLHLTAAENNIPVAECLLRIGADPRVANEAGDDVLHLAVRSGSVEMVQVLLESQLVDKNSPGWNGETALHVAASQNELECAKLLLQHRADITRRCGSGGLPIHHAARFGSLDVLRFFLQTPKLRVDEMLRSVDDEEATPLHLAVNRGDCDTAELLLEAGAPINAQMFEQSTPLHIACALGASDIVGMIHDFNVLEFGRVLRIGDAQGMTPVHRAAMFNHWHLLRFLIDKHASLDTRDSAGRSVLVLAASRGSWDAVSELLTSGADPLICSNDGQNFLHYVVALGGDPESFKDEIRPTSRFAAILNGKDNAGLTPLHYAAQCGFGTCCDSLVKLGALITAKSRELKTPVHLAAEFGRYSTMKKLLASADRVPAFHGVVNDADSRGQTPLHLAAAHGHLKIVMLLLSKGALMARNLDGALPLHSACATDKKEIVESLITGHAHLVNAVDKRGNTALHIAAESNAHLSAVTLLNSGARLLTNGENLTALDLAIMNGNQEVTEAMVQTDRWKELLLQPSSLYTWPSHGLIQEFPDIMLKVLDRCQEPSKDDRLSKEFNINYDYKILQPDLNSDIGLKGRNQRKPLEALNQMVNWKRVDLLCHPVCTTYLEAKWWTYGLLFHVITLTLYATFLTLLTFLILTGIDFDLRPNLRQLSIDRIKKYKPELLAGNATRVGPVDLSMPAGDVNMNVGDKTLLAFVISFAMLHLLKKVFQLRREGLSYFIRLITLFELTLYLSTMTFSIGFFDTANYYMTWQSQWLLGAVSILFAWVNMFFYLRRYGELGMHVMILLRTMKILTEAMVVLFVVVVAFSITFYAINPAKILPADPFFYTKSHDGDGMMDIYWTSYSSLQVAILRVSDQMIGDADVIVNFIDPILNGQMAFPVLTYIFAMISIVVITILLQSLVIGLTVGEIRDLRENVTLQRKIMQVDLHTEIEEKFTNVIMASWDIKPERRVYPNRMRSRFLKSILEYFAATEQKENDDTLVLRRSSSHPSISNGVMNDAKIVDELSAKVDQQHELLRTIIQSMKIQMEADILDDEDVEARRKKLSRFVDRSRPHSRFADSRSHGILDEE